MVKFNDSEDFSEGSEGLEESKIEFKEVVLQVCRHWRAVAISVPMLWTYIRLDGLYPRSRIALFLARSGDTAPLELELDITGNLAAELVTETLAFVVENGGATSRWASLKVWGELPSVLLAVIDFIAGANLDNLHTLGLINDYEEPLVIGDLVSEALLGRDLSQSVMFHKPPPLLRNVELDGIAGGLLFATPSVPLLSNLMHLELGTIPCLPPIEGLYELLMHNPGLESLVLDMSMTSDPSFDLRFPRDKQVKLQHLRRFVLKDPLSTAWALEVLIRIDAPGVEEFTLDLDDSDMLADRVSAIASYIGTGRKGGQLMTRPQTTKSELNNIGPIYPALRHFAIGPLPGGSEHLRIMLQELNTITRLDWELGTTDNGAFLELAKLPVPCPRLEHLRTDGIQEHELMHVVRSRKQQGNPLKTLEVNSSDWDWIKDSTKEYLKGELERFGQYEDGYD